jgi:hypothetical protein
VPGAKNSVVNWVDLHTRPLPAAILGAVSQRAAKDLAKADLEQAISGRRTGWMGALAALAAFAFVCVFLWLGPRQFSFFLGRAFNPFMSAASVPTRTQLTVLRPEGGNTTLTIGRALPIVVQVDGRIPDPRNPDALKLLYRYQEGDPYQERFLQEDAGREWSTVVSALDVHDGFWYKITGGDAETPEYRVNVRTTPLITHFLATYHFRPYVARNDEIRHDRKLEALCGTEVLLAVRTNRSLKDARLDLETKEGRRTLTAERPATDPQAFQVRLTLAESGTYRLHFTSVEGETYADASTHEVIAIPDQPPQVELTLPGQDIRLPANGLLRVEGKASDDVGVKSLTLRMEIAGGQKLQGKPYRSEKDLTLPGGGNPREVLYKDFVDLAKVKSAEGAPVKLESGMEMEYWLEASDACDYHRPHVAESKHFRVKIIEPQKDEQKQQQDRNAAQKEQQDHQAQQDKQLNQENKTRDQERKEQEARNQKEQQGQDGEKGSAQQKPGDQKDGQAKPGEQGGEGQGQQNQPKQGEGTQNQANPTPGQEKPQPGNTPGAAQQQPGAEQRQKDQDLQKTAEKLKDLLDKQQQGQPQQGSGQGENPSGTTQPAPKPESDKGTRPMPQPGDSASSGDKPAGSGQGGQPKTGPKEGSAKPEPSSPQQDGSQPKPEDATPSTVAKLARDLKSLDQRTREQAARQLEKIKDQASDPQAKEDARKALEEANRKPQPTPGEGGPEKGTQEPTPMPASPGKGQAGETPEKQPGTGSPEKNEGNKEKGTNQGAKGGQPEKGGQPGEGSPMPNGPKQPAGDTPGIGGTDRGPNQGEPRPEKPEPNKVKPSKPEGSRAMQMQLDDFKKRIDKNILRDAKMSEKDLQQFLKDWQDLIRRKQADEKKEPLPGAQRTSPLRSTGSQRTGTAGSGTTDDVQGDGRPLPPPGYREARREFTRLLSEPDKDKKP